MMVVVSVVVAAVVVTAPLVAPIEATVVLSELHVPVPEAPDALKVVPVPWQIGDAGIELIEPAVGLAVTVIDSEFESLPQPVVTT